MTAHKVGTATITATCGNYSATCAVSISHVVELTFAINTYCSKTSGKDFLEGGTLNNYAVGYLESGTLLAYNGSTGKYPVPIPDGASQIDIVSPNFKPYGFWVNALQKSTTNNCAFAYDPDPNFKYNSSVLGSRNVPIPDRTSGTYEGMDACIFVFAYQGTITQGATESITVTFS